MIDLHQHILAVVSLPAISVAAVSRALNAPLRKLDENPYWEFYHCGRHGVFEQVHFNLSRDKPDWLLAWDYAPAQAPLEEDLNLAPYGALQKLDLAPRIPPEGVETQEYAYGGLQLFIQFTTRSRRLYGAALHHKS